MESYKNRSLEIGQRVRVYMNLNRGDSVFSIADHKSGLVVAYAEKITVSDAVFTVRQSGRRKVLQTRHKNVHAFVTGTFLGAEKVRPLKCTVEVYYNPYVTEQFTALHYSVPVTESRLAHLSDKRVWILKEDVDFPSEQMQFIV